MSIDWSTIQHLLGFLLILAVFIGAMVGSEILLGWAFGPINRRRAEEAKTKALATLASYKNGSLSDDDAIKQLIEPMHDYRRAIYHT